MMHKPRENKQLARATRQRPFILQNKIVGPRGVWGGKAGMSVSFLSLFLRLTLFSPKSVPLSSDFRRTASPS
jgi:hypothetical protein